MERKNLKKTRVGVVVSNKMDKTITVYVERRVKHPIYNKYYIQSKKIHAHDEENTCNEGDKVKVMETRKLSKSKCWRLLEVLERKK
ncbi:MAG: 30S ribosomal protein S17 [Candidatus Cloacimonadota bacterium]|nr:ribosomal protein S17 [uncultured bacterium]PID31137.1 MAG: 30S ribosomal protein S17 [Candidatus Cloacimonadota bacterium]PIE79129.1 MAG: 30S ribosomal protein S17 [Candidatus Delongbacteria bacterium]